MLRILEGVRVLEVAEHGFVPSAGTVLADWGAEVIKVEHPVRGDPMRQILRWGIIPGVDPSQPDFMVESLFRSKRCIALDLTRDTGRELLLKLARRADVFLTNLLPASRRRLRIDYPEIRGVNSRIVYAKGHGQGARGAEAEAGGFDAVSFWSRGSVQERLTPPGQPLVGQRPGTGDFMSGLTLAGGISAALFRRERTGESIEVDVALLNVATWMMSPDINAACLYGRDLPKTAPVETQSVPAIAGTYAAKDGKLVTLMMWQDDARFFPIFARAAGYEDLLADPRFADAGSRVSNKAELVAELTRRFATRTRAEWVDRLSKSECIWGLVQSPVDIPEDPQVQANGYLMRIQRKDGSVFRAVGAPVQFNGEPPAARHAAQELGEETETVLREAGATEAEVQAARAAGAIR